MQTMMPQNNMGKPFDVIRVPLEGSNLIEASAGTGKTYSIAILVLRLLLEKKMSVRDILMVTFTNAAVAELQDRIRQYVRMAHKYLSEYVEMDGVRDVVDQAVSELGRAEVEQSLHKAVLLLDETSVMTIHSFCQQTLSECAFETDQLFGAELVKDTNAIISEEINRFWRSEIATLPLDLLELLHVKGHKLDREKLLKLVKEVEGGKVFYGHIPVGQRLTIKEKYERLLTYVQQESGPLNELANGHAAALKPLIATPAHFLRKVIEIYWQPRRPAFINRFSKVTDIYFELFDTIYSSAIDSVRSKVALIKQQNSLLQFDDLIKNVHRSVAVKKNKVLLKVLNDKYKAVFIDEFQDTDVHQFEIFHTAFDEFNKGRDEKPVVFYIGDPKQSIYGFRRADLSVYFNAASSVQDRCYTMDVNHRSSESLVAAMNTFFDIYDPFHYTGEPDMISYQPVKPSGRKKDLFYKEGAPDKPISIFTVGKKEDICESVAAQVLQLLNPGLYTLQIDGANPRIRPSDIGILVRSKFEARDVKRSLARLGIPAVTVDDTGILQSEEATYVLYFLDACVQVSRAQINRALLSPFTGFTSADVLLQDENEMFGRFKEYSNYFQKSGVYTALSCFIRDFEVRSRLSRRANGDRMLTNLLHLAELLHKVQTEKNYSPLELVSWLKRGKEGAEEGDEYEQRIESDEEAVKIVTIHKSKGLEYKIVFAPYLDLSAKVSSRRAFCSFKENNTYWISETKRLTEDQKKLYCKQEEQENRRLIYVALTRAVYKCYLYKVPSQDEKGKPVTTSLTPFFDQCAGLETQMLEITGAPGPVKGWYKPEEESKSVLMPRIARFQLAQKNWCKMSFSFLAAKGHMARLYKQEASEGYDDFVFNQLRKGEKTGLMLHYIFEHIDFADEKTWEPAIEVAIKRFLPGKGPEYGGPLQELLRHVLNTSISCGGQTFQLNNVTRQRRLNEFEFDFNVKPFDLEQLKAVLEMEEVRFKYENQKQLEGVMYGIMDMFFEYNSKYYILDWKSNHLGYETGAYKQDALELAMKENNYHLQYLLYTVAARKYLQSRLGTDFCYERDFGGVIYLFVRGVRQEGTTGIFTCHPAARLLDKVSAILDGWQGISVSGIPLGSEKAPLRLKKQHFTGTLVEDLIGILCSHKVLARPGRHELLYSDEQVSDGQMYYFTPSYYGALLDSIRESMAKGALQALIKEDRSFTLLKAMESAREVSDEDIDGIRLTPHFIAQ